MIFKDNCFPISFQSIPWKQKQNEPIRSYFKIYWTKSNWHLIHTQSRDDLPRVSVYGDKLGYVPVQAGSQDEELPEFRKAKELAGRRKGRPRPQKFGRGQNVENRSDKKLDDNPAASCALQTGTEDVVREPGVDATWRGRRGHFSRILTTFSRANGLDFTLHGGIQNLTGVIFVVSRNFLREISKVPTKSVKIFTCFQSNQTMTKRAKYEIGRNPFLFWPFSTKISFLWSSLFKNVWKMLL